MNNRSADIHKYIQAIAEKEVSKFEKLNLNLLIYEATFGPYNMPFSLAKKYCEEAFNDVQLHFWMPYREKVLSIILEGLKSSRLRELVKSKIEEWYQCRARWREDLYNVISNWEDKDDKITHYFIRGLFDEELPNKRAAMKALVSKKSGDEQLGNFLVGIIKGPTDSITKAIAIEGLISGWQDHIELKTILDYARNSISPELVLVAIKANILNNCQSQDDLNHLLNFGARTSFRLNYHFREDLSELLLKGWPKNQQIKSICLNSLTQRGSDENLEYETATKVLFNGYLEEADVIEYCINEIRNKEFPFNTIHTNAWELIKEKCSSNKLIVKAVDEWLQKKQHDDRNVAFAALIGLTDIAKEVLLEKVKTSSFLHWPAWALLEGWGIKDEQVSGTLNEIVYGKASNASRIGHLIPAIIHDKVSAQKRIFELIQDPESVRFDFLFTGLEQVNEDLDQKIILEDLIKIYHERTGYEKRAAAICLIQNYPEDKRVKQLAKQEMLKRDGLYEVIARSYGNDESFRETVLKISFPLPGQLRQIIAKQLGEEVNHDGFSVSLLELYDYDEDTIVKTQSSISFHKLIKENQSYVLQAVDKLSETIKCYGPDHEDRRQAALCGLLTLERLDVFLNAKETIGEERNCSVPINTLFTKNIPFIEHILKHWNYIKGCLGDEILNRFTKYDKNPLSFWEDISLLVTEEYPELRDEIVGFLEIRSERTIKTNLLKLLSKERPRSVLLLEYLLESLNPEKESEDGLIYTAAKLLGEQYNNEINVLEELMTELKEYRFNEPVTIALCEGWPDSEQLIMINEFVKDNKPSMKYMTYFQLISRFAKSDKVFDIIIDRINNDKNRLYVWQKEEVNRPILRRIKEDDQLAENLIKKLSDNPSLNEKANIPRLISVSRGITSELRQWIINEINNELENISKEAEDLVTGEIRPLAHILLDII